MNTAGQFMREAGEPINQEQVNRFLKKHPRHFIKAGLKYWFEFIGIKTGPEGIELIKVKPPERKPREVPTREELNTMLETLLKIRVDNKDVYWTYRLLYLTGARKKEILSLTLNDFNFEGCELTFKTKGGMFRTAGIRKEHLDELRKYLVEEKGVLGSDRCFFTDSANVHSAYINLRRYVKNLGPEVGKMLAKTHNFRRAAINEILDRTGGNIKIAQSYIGHKSITSTDKYVAEWEKEKLRKKGEEILDD